jgi:hypothetical protein
MQKTLNLIRNQIDTVDAETKWAALEWMLGTCSSVVALAKKMTTPKAKTGTHSRYSSNQSRQAAQRAKQQYGFE